MTFISRCGLLRLTLFTNVMLGIHILREDGSFYCVFLIFQVQFGTLGDYFTALRQATDPSRDNPLIPAGFPTFSGDFFTYSDRLVLCKMLVRACSEKSLHHMAVPDSQSKPSPDLLGKFCFYVDVLRFFADNFSVVICHIAGNLVKINVWQIGRDQHERNYY